VRQTKAGHTTCGSQRYHCHACQKLYSPFPKQHGYPTDTRQTAVAMYLEGNGFRQIARLLKTSPQTIANWVSAYQTHLQTKSPCLPAPTTLETGELDELYTFVGSKKTKSTS
jgi:transposase-like protein